MKILLFCLFQFLALETSCGLNISPENIKNQFNALSKSVSAFNSKMFEKISEIEKGNIFYSPLGLHMALFQVYLGASWNSTTRQELSRLLQLDAEDYTEYLSNYQDALAFFEVQSSDQRQQTEVKIANRMYAGDDLVIKPQYRYLTNHHLKSAVEQVNFLNSQPTIDKINNYVNNATKGLIQKALEELSPDTRLIQLNVIYFKGRWKYPFEERFTRLGDFHIDNSTMIQVTSMYMAEPFKMEYFPELESNVLDIPYENETMSMIIILPDKTTDVVQVQKKLQNFETEVLFERLKSTHRYMTEGNLPKFEISFDVPNMIETMKSLGVNLIFGKDADLSNISEEELFVSEIKHKATVKVSIS